MLWCSPSSPRSNLDVFRGYSVLCEGRYENYFTALCTVANFFQSVHIKTTKKGFTSLYNTPALDLLSHPVRFQFMWKTVMTS